MYSPVHGHLSLYVCLLGCLFNLLNILVLTHANMRNNPINMILTGIAIADCLNQLEYIPFSVHMYLLDPDARDQKEMVSPEIRVFIGFIGSWIIDAHKYIYLFPVFGGLGLLHAVSYELQQLHPHGLRLLDTFSRNLEVHHDQVPNSECWALYCGEV